MGLHAEVPLVALLRLMHLRIPLRGTILRRTGRGDDRGIHDGPSADLQPLLGQIRPDQGKQLLAQLVGFQEMPELTKGRLIRYRLAPQINANELPHGAGVIQGLLYRRDRQIEPMLQEMDTEDSLDSDRRTPGPLRLGILRLDDRRQLAPRHHLLHLPQKPLAAGRFPILFKARFCKGLLRHGGAS